MNKNIILMLLSMAVISIGQAQADSSNNTVLKTNYHSDPSGISGAGFELSGLFSGTTNAVGTNQSIAKPIGKMIMAGFVGVDYPSVARVWDWTGTDVTTAFSAMPGFIPGYNTIIEGHSGLMVANSHLTIGRVEVGVDPVTSGVDDGIYFGVWHRDNNTAVLPPAYTAGGPYTYSEADAVFFSGPEPTGYTAGAGTTVKYDVLGLSHDTTSATTAIYSNGVFTANFTSNQLSGTLSNGLDIGTANISASGVINGVGATIPTHSGTGVVLGQFYGAGAPKLAGIAKFGPITGNGIPGIDTAFGGVKK